MTQKKSVPTPSKGAKTSKTPSKCDVQDPKTTKKTQKNIKMEQKTVKKNNQKLPGFVEEDLNKKHFKQPKQEEVGENNNENEDENLSNDEQVQEELETAQVTPLKASVNEVNCKRPRRMITKLFVNLDDDCNDELEAQNENTDLSFNNNQNKRICSDSSIFGQKEDAAPAAIEEEFEEFTIDLSMKFQKNGANAASKKLGFHIQQSKDTQKQSSMCLYKGQKYQSIMGELKMPTAHSGSSEFSKKVIEIGSFNSFAIGEDEKIYNFLDREMLLQKNQDEKLIALSKENMLLSFQQDGGCDASSLSQRTAVDANGLVIAALPPKKKIICNCKKSKCLKLYCDCFQNGEQCSDECNCCDCCNDGKHELDLEKAKRETLLKNPSAFKSKLKESHGFGSAGQTVLEHFKGCNCKKSNCQKKYCECFNQGVKCTANCKCEDCLNGIPHEHENENDVKMEPEQSQQSVVQTKKTVTNQDKKNINEPPTQHLLRNVSNNTHQRGYFQQQYAAYYQANEDEEEEEDFEEGECQFNDQQLQQGMSSSSSSKNNSAKKSQKGLKMGLPRNQFSYFPPHHLNPLKRFPCSVSSPKEYNEHFQQQPLYYRNPHHVNHFAIPPSHHAHLLHNPNPYHYGYPPIHQQQQQQQQFQDPFARLFPQKININNNNNGNAPTSIKKKKLQRQNSVIMEEVAAENMENFPEENKENESLMGSGKKKKHVYFQQSPSFTINYFDEPNNNNNNNIINSSSNINNNEIINANSSSSSHHQMPVFTH